MTVRFLTPPVEDRTCGFHRIRLSTFGRSPWGYHEASVSISAASTGLHPCLIPCRQHTRENSRGTAYAFAGYFVRRLLFVLRPSKGEGPSPSVLTLVYPAFLGSDSLCPIRLSVALAFRWGLPCLLPTRLHIPHEVSRVPHRRLKRNDAGGVFLLAPSGALRLLSLPPG